VVELDLTETLETVETVDMEETVALELVRHMAVLVV
jgi:hypothetical protein